MGDGRYYSGQQFFSVLVLTVIIIFLTVSMMLLVYKNVKHKKQILLMYILLIIGCISGLIYQVYPDEEGIVFFSKLTKGAILAHALVGLFFYTEMFRKQSGDFWIKVCASIFFLLPLVLFFTHLIQENLLLICLIINLVFTANRLTKYRISGRLFTDVKEMMLDYVFIVSSSGQVIFANKRVYDSGLFRDIDFIDYNNIEAIFLGEVVDTDLYGFRVYQIMNERAIYCQIQYKELYSGSDFSGRIITLTDITPYINMLNRLHENESALQKANKDLLKKKGQVYQLERQREISSLLQEISSKQYKSMLDLKEKIGMLSVEDPLFMNKVESLIMVAKKDLKQVRQAVSLYREG